MKDIFDHDIMCKNCNKKMQKANFVKEGFVLRTLSCPNCNEKIIHPVDEQEYKKYLNLKNKEFKVKMRLVGNSYAVSIPREIVSFMDEQKKMMDHMVKLCFEDLGRLSLNFDNFQDNNSEDIRIIKSREYRVIKNNKPVVHVKQFSDSANPEKTNFVKFVKRKRER